MGSYNFYATNGIIMYVVSLKNYDPTGRGFMQSYPPNDSNVLAITNLTLEIHC